MPLPARDHRITLEEASALVKRYRAGTEEKAGAFPKSQLMDLLSQPGCEGMRVYYGRHEDGRPALVLVGIDKTDNDMTGGIVEDLHFPCPPLCGDGNALNS